MTYSEIIDAFKGKKVVVLGDVMLDRYIYGNATRISPEAPVPIILKEHQEDKLGGAANVAINCKTLGAEVFLVGRIGLDQPGKCVESILHETNLETKFLLKSKHVKTTCKTRVMASNQQVIRLDDEQIDDLLKDEQRAIFQSIEWLIENQSIDVLIFEDYDKGVLNKSLIEKVIDLCQKNKVKTCVDPKKKHFLDYAKVDLFKPNLKEMKEGLNDDSNQVEHLITKLFDRLHVKSVLLTRSRDGVYCASNNGKTHSVKAHLRDISDVSGAGDTVVAVAALSLSSGASIQQIAELSNLAGGLACERLGVWAIDGQTLKNHAILDLK